MPSKEDLSSPGLAIRGDENGWFARPLKEEHLHQSRYTENLEIPAAGHAKRFHVSQFPMAVGRACTACLRMCSQFVGIFLSGSLRHADALIVDLTQDIYFLPPLIFFLQKSQLVSREAASHKLLRL